MFPLWHVTLMGKKKKIKWIIVNATFLVLCALAAVVPHTQKWDVLTQFDM